MFLLLLGCAAPTPPLVWLDASALREGVRLDGAFRTFPVVIDEGATVGGLDLDPLPGEIAWVSFDTALHAELMDVGWDVDPDAVLLEGDEADLLALASQLGAELRSTDAGARLEGPGVLADLVDAAPDCVDAAWPVFVEDAEVDAAGEGSAAGTIVSGSRDPKVSTYVFGATDTALVMPEGEAEAGPAGANWSAAQAAAARVALVGLYVCADGPLLLDAAGGWSRAQEGYETRLGTWTVEEDRLLLTTPDTVEGAVISEHTIEGDTLSCPRPE